MMNAAMAVNGNGGGGVTREFMVTGWHCCRLYHGCGGNWSELVSEVVVSMNWSFSCIIKNLLGDFLVCLVLMLVWMGCGSVWWGSVLLKRREEAFRFV